MIQKINNNCQSVERFARPIGDAAAANSVAVALPPPQRQVARTKLCAARRDVRAASRTLDSDAPLQVRRTESAPDAHAPPLEGETPADDSVLSASLDRSAAAVRRHPNGGGGSRAEPPPSLVWPPFACGAGRQPVFCGNNCAEAAAGAVERAKHLSSRQQLRRRRFRCRPRSARSARRSRRASAACTRSSTACCCLQRCSLCAITCAPPPPLNRVNRVLSNDYVCGARELDPFCCLDSAEETGEERRCLAAATADAQLTAAAIKLRVEAAAQEPKITPETPSLTIKTTSNKSNCPVEIASGAHTSNQNESQRPLAEPFSRLCSCFVGKLTSKKKDGAAGTKADCGAKGNAKLIESKTVEHNLLSACECNKRRPFGSCYLSLFASSRPSVAAATFDCANKCRLEGREQSCGSVSFEPSEAIRDGLARCSAARMATSYDDDGNDNEELGRSTDSRPQVLRKQKSSAFRNKDCELVRISNKPTSSRATAAAAAMQPNWPPAAHQVPGGQRQVAAACRAVNSLGASKDDDYDDDYEGEDSSLPPNYFQCKVALADDRATSLRPVKVQARNKPPLKERENWDKTIEFLLAVIGFAVDLGNVWRFPYICYKNGGGAFLIPYTIMFILGGLPIFYLEMSLGQYFSSGCLTVWRCVCPMAKGIGYAMCVLNFFTGLYYNTIISWAVFFFVESFTDNLPWTSCSNIWNSADCLTIEQRLKMRANAAANFTQPAQANSPTAAPYGHFSSPTRDYFEREVLMSHLSKGIDDLGSVRAPLAIYLAIVFICIYLAIWKGVKSTGKAVWITALLPYFVLIPLLIRGVFLEGASLGIKYYLYPDWSKILDADVWVEAAKQIYFSLGPGFGTLMALSSYNKFHHNCKRDALIAATVNYFASFISGLVIFAVLGYMATMENVSIEEVATEGPGLVFQVYPEGLATMRCSAMWSVLFFMMVITLGIDSTFGGLESVITGLCDEYPRVLRAHRSIFIAILIIIIYLCSLPTTTYGGTYVIYVLESYGTSLSLLFIVLVETIIVCWLYGTDRFCENLEEMYGERPSAYWRICWKYISPSILLLIFIAACGQELDKYHILSNGDYTYPSWAPTIGLLMTGSSVCCVPIYAIYYIKTKTSGTLMQRLKIATRPIESEPRGERDRYADARMDKIRDHDDTHLDTDI